jgi:hypothetical protein
VLFEVKGEINRADSMHVFEFGGQIKEVVFPAAGEHRLQALAGETVIAERSLFVTLKAGGSAPPAAPASSPSRDRPRRKGGDRWRRF